MATSSTDVHIGPSGTAPESPSAHLTPDDRVGLLRAMLLMRAIEERAMNLYRQGKVPGSFYDGFGQEAVSVGATWALAGPDRLCVLHRDLGAHLVRGVQPANILAQYMGREAGITSGRDGNVHFGDPRTGCVGMVSMLPDMMLVAAGMAMAFKLRREARCALTWFGDGSTSRGDFHEAMNWAGVQHLPVIFILENNQFAYSTPIKQQFAVNPVERAAGYGFPGVSVDGNDAEAVFEATRVARERAISGGGPTLIEAVTMRMHGHGAHDDMKYVPKALVEEWRQKDPIDRQSARVAALGIDVDALRADRCPIRRRRPTASFTRARPRRSCWRTGRRRGAAFRSRHERDDLPAGDLRRAAHGDARRRARPADGRGHRRLRRCLQGDRRLHRGVRRRSRHGHAAGGVGDRRHRRRRRGRRPATSVRDAVRRLRLLRL
jgi:pyruvate dehydrogenase E1 component alpha subunit